MEILNKLDHQIDKILYTLKVPTLLHGDVDTYSVLYTLASDHEWGEAELQTLDFLSKRLDISKKLFLGYHNNGRKTVDTELTSIPWLELAAAILFKATLISQGKSDQAIHLKRFNTLFKLLDIISPEWLQPDTELGSALESDWQALHQSLPELAAVRKTSRSNKNNTHTIQQETIIPLTVLFYEGPIARAYLATIKFLGFKPQRIIELVAAKDVSTKKALGKWLPKGMRESYAASIQRTKIHYWPIQLKKSKPDFINGILSEVQEKFYFSEACLDNAHALTPLASYSDDVESLLIDDLKDKGLLDLLSKEPASAILYTGGGMVPAKLLGLDHLRFLHIHPGFLPNIRGADCALWSSLLTGHTSATCFYMSPGIDTGDIILPCWLPKFSFSMDVQGIDRQFMYRSIYSFLDPWVRSFVLRVVIANNSQFTSLSSETQADSDGTTFHFMHPQLQNTLFKKLFV